MTLTPNVLTAAAVIVTLAAYPVYKQEGKWRAALVLGVALLMFVTGYEWRQSGG